METVAGRRALPPAPAWADMTADRTSPVQPASAFRLQIEHGALRVREIAQPRLSLSAIEFRAPVEIPSPQARDWAVGINENEQDPSAHQIPAKRAGKADEILDASGVCQHCKWNRN